MNPTGTTQETELVLRRLGDAVPSTLRQVLFESEFARAMPLILALFAVAFLIGLFVDYLLRGSRPVRRHEFNPSTGWLRWAGVALLCVVAVVTQNYITRLADFDYRTAWHWPPPWHNWVVLATLAIPAVFAILPALVYVPYVSQESLRHHTASRGLLRAFAGTAIYLTIVAFLDNYFLEDTSAAKPASGSSSATASTQAVFWITLTSAVFAIASIATFVNYVRDLGWRSLKHWIELAIGLVLLYLLLGGALVGFYFLNAEITGVHASPTALFLAGALAVPALIALSYPIVPKSMNVYWATVLSALRINVYGLLAAIFLLPSCQTWERTEKRSRVIMLIDVTPSMKLSDDIATLPGQPTQTRIDKVIDLLTDEKVALIKNLIEQNPVYIYRFGTRLDEETQSFAKGDAAWAKAEWNAFARYDFRAWLTRGLAADGIQKLQATVPFSSEGAGNPDWAMDWFNKPETETFPANLTEADAATLRSNKEKLGKRVDVARSILQGTNIPGAITDAINRESTNMAQGVIVLSDGRSNLGSDADFLELKERAAREQIPVFTIAVGEDRQTVSITLTDIVAPERLPPDEPSKIVVEADGVNLANQQVEVKLGLYMPSRDPKKDPPDHELSANLTFAPGDPPHGSVEFLIDPAKLPEALTEIVKDASGPHRRMKEGPWSAVARIAKDKREVFAGKEHVRERTGIQVLNRPLRVLLISSGPLREYQTLRTMLVREVKENRAELSILMQNEAGAKGEVVQDVPPERMLVRFPHVLDTSGNTRVEDKFYNLNEYDLIIAFDPDWSEFTEEMIANLKTWVNNLGGGLILVADNHNLFQLARAETNSRLSPLLEILPVIPDDIVVQQVRPIPKTPRRLLFKPSPDSDLLKLSGDPENSDPTAGWEMFFTKREKFIPNAEDPMRDLLPTRGFFSSYPVKMVKPGAQVLAELADIDEKGDRALRPWLVITQPARGRTAYMASAELYRMRAIDPDLGPEYHQRFWVKLARYISANRDAKAARGRVLLNKEYISGAPIRVQARVLDPKGLPYTVSGKDIKFQVLPLTSAGDRLEREDPITKQKAKLVYGPYQMAAKKAAGDFDGYYQAEVTADARLFPPGENRYRVVIEVPDSPGETIEGEFMIRQSDPEIDRRQPDFAAMLTLASEFDGSVQSRVVDTAVRERLLTSLRKENGRPKLAFLVAERDLISLIPKCMKFEERNFRNRGAIQDLWDRPAYLTMSDREIRLLDFELTWERTFLVLCTLFGSALALMLIRGLWLAIASNLPNVAANVIGTVSVALLLAVAIVPFFLGAETMTRVFQPKTAHWSADSWVCVLSVMVVLWTVVICRLNTVPAFITLGVQAVLTGIPLLLFWLFVESDYSYHVEVGVALLTFVGLLSAEWLTRKLLRLA